MTAASVATSDAWMEKCLVSISKIGGADAEFASLTETLDFDIGDKDIEGIVLVNGGRVAKWNPEGDSTVTFEAWPIEVGTDTGTTGKGFFDLMHDADASQPLAIANSHSRNKYRCAFLWTDDATAVTGYGATASAKRAVRLVFANGFFTSVKPSFTDGALKFTVTFKIVPYAKDGTSNFKAESTDGSTTLAALASYTTSANW